jgi:uncharacterized protein
MKTLIYFALGLLFGTGLVVAGMSDPAKVLSFLDLAAIPTGGWDPSLAFVMGGAVIVTSVGYRLAWRRPAPVFGTSFHRPTTTRIDTRVIIGPALFGVGWGLSGLCPGPAFTALVFGGTSAILFMVAMVAGMLVARWQATGLPQKRGAHVSP